MVSILHMKHNELVFLLKNLKNTYEEYRINKIYLNIARGNPSEEQLELSNKMLTLVNENIQFIGENGVDIRNYGVIDGTVEARILMADLMKIDVSNVMVLGNSSLSIMYNLISHSMTHGILGDTPWNRLEKVKFLCPVPGYDRHFAITEHFGIEMIPIPMLQTGPNMDIIEKLVASDESIKGIWCVPKYSNPTGTVYSDETVRRFARIEPKANDFRIYWDNAYGVHGFYKEMDEILEILHECEIAGHQDMIYKFSSTSKISFPGGGIAGIATSARNLEEIKKNYMIQTIGYDKLNQIRHAKFFVDSDGIAKHMKKHANILKPKFETVLQILQEDLGDSEFGVWTKPRGGYFISFDAMSGCAMKIVEMAKNVGLIMTKAGATFPYGIDPKDQNIRIAPTSLDIENLRLATKLFCLCVKIVTIEKILDQKGLNCRY